MATLDIFGTDLFGQSLSPFRIINLFKLWTKRLSLMSISRLLFLTQLTLPLWLVILTFATLYLTPSAPTSPMSWLHSFLAFQDHLSLGMTSSINRVSTPASP